MAAFDNKYEQKLEKFYPGKAIVKITPSNTSPLARPCNAMRIGATGGTLVFLAVNNNTREFPSGPVALPVAAYEIIPIEASWILASSDFGTSGDTTDVDVWAIY